MGQVKIFSRISKENFDKLTQIKESYGFKSNYQIMQCLVHTFLKLADSVAKKQEPHPSIECEVEDMFKEFANAESPTTDVRYLTPTRTPHYRCDGKES